MGLEYAVIHREAKEIILKGLLKYGLVNGSIDDLMRNNIGNTFMPHGLGHWIGYRTHDVGFSKRYYAKTSDPFTNENKSYLSITAKGVTL